jgi:hypothetical protein
MVEVKTLFGFISDPEQNNAQQKIIDELWENEGVEDRRDLQRKMIQSILSPDIECAPEVLATMEKVGPRVSARRWVLENAARRKLTVNELLRLSINSRIAQDSK